MNEEKLYEKLKEAIEIAKKNEDNNSQIVLLGLIGAKQGGQDGMLAEWMQDVVKNTLIPAVKEKKWSEEN